ncbi:MAG: phosphate ABC transporter substrate-binding protein PstS [Phycisphaerae bacterium]|nr:phosphate ABC transporter substrate-binding protein PstS [Tepidisphaeraceae bacterium]
MRMFSKIAAVALSLGVAGAASADVKIQGAGATFPDPLYQRMIGEYIKAKPDVKIDYQAIGSGGGIKAITSKTVHFAGSDAPLSKKEIEAAGGGDGLVEIPTCAGSVVPAYNVPGVNQPLNFTGELLADIFMGKVGKWNDAKIAAINPGVALPDLAITPAWRTDGSGTNFVFTNYLGTQSEEFKTTVGVGKAVKWPVGQGGNGNAGVAAIVQQSAGALGYVEQNFAEQNKIPFGAVKNKAGKFVKASGESVSAAGAGAADKLKGNLLAADIWNQDGEGAYPISAFTYVIVYKDLRTAQNAEQAQALADFLWYVTHDGQKLAPSLGYAPLAEPVQKKVEEALKSLNHGGKAVTPVAVR